MHRITRLLPLLGFLCLSCTAREDAAPRNLLLITIDTLRADHLGLYGYPRDTSPTLDEFASRSVVFENAWVQWPKTTPSMVSMFSATYPHRNGIVISARDQHVPESLLMLPEALRDAGFVTAGVAANGVLGRESNFPQGLETYRELWLEKTGLHAENVTRVALEELRRLTESENRFFLWVHYLDPHWPYEPPTEFSRPFLEDEYFRSDIVTLNEGRNEHGGIAQPVWERSDEVDDVAWYQAHYDGEIRYFDHHLQDLLDGLEDTNVDGETLVVLTADHGEALGEQGYYFSHGHFAYEGDVRVPLLIHWPTLLHGRRILQPVELVGLAPTLAKILELSPEMARFTGRSWLPLIEAREGSEISNTAVFSASGGAWTRRGDAYTVTVRRGPWKLFYNQSHRSQELRGGREFELYNLDRDPLERHDISSTRADVLQPLLAEARSWLAHSPAPLSDPVKPMYDKATEENLRELGYVE